MRGPLSLPCPPTSPAGRLAAREVYRAFGAIWAQKETDPLPLTEASPVRDERLADPGVPLPDWDFAWSAYDKVPIERESLARGAVVLRLPVVFGEHDYLVREEA